MTWETGDLALEWSRTSRSRLGRQELGAFVYQGPLTQKVVGEHSLILELVRYI
jgi:hypothetical protein